MSFSFDLAVAHALEREFDSVDCFGRGFTRFETFELLGLTP